VSDAQDTFAISNTEKLAVWRNDKTDGLFSFTVAIDNVPCLDEFLDPPVTGSIYPLYKSDFDCG
jgi:hypothetical protein